MSRNADFITGTQGHEARSIAVHAANPLFFARSWMGTG
jgi:hypothetical protein